MFRFNQKRTERTEGREKGGRRGKGKWTGNGREREGGIEGQGKSKGKGIEGEGKEEMGREGEGKAREME